MEKTTALIIGLALTLFIAGCTTYQGPVVTNMTNSALNTTQPESPGNGSPASSPAQSYAVIARDVPGLGRILVDDRNMTLYTFKNDRPDVSTCYDGCATAWPPLLAQQGTQPGTEPGLAGHIGVITRNDSTMQVTWDSMPLYLFFKDTKPGDAKGNGLNASGNYWYVVPAK